MSSNNDTNHTNHSAKLYTIYPGSLPTQGNVNYGFYSSHPLAPPPKYEDVMSGHYMCMNDTNIHPQPTLANTSNNQHINCSEISNFQSFQCEPHSQQVYKNKNIGIVGRPLEQHSMPPSVLPLMYQQETSQTGVIFVAPISKVTENNRKLLLIFVISFFVGFITILLWKLVAQ